MLYLLLIPVLYVVLVPIFSTKSVPMEETDAFFKAIQADHDAVNNY